MRPLDPNLPSLNLRQFCLKIFQHCPLFSVYDAELHSKAFSEFLAYKTRVPVRGAILLNDALDEVVLVKGYKKGSSWSFPRGKINKDEKDIDCAIREVYEETGYDIRQAGLFSNEEDVRSIDITMREQNMKLFVFPGVPMDTHFEPRTRKEISKIEWYRLSDLPTLKKMKQQQQLQSGQELAKNANKFYMVAPFLVPLKKYIAQLRKRSTSSSQVHQQMNQAMTNELQINSISAPAVKTDVLSVTSDMTRLMAQLRQSQQASRENNFPEVSDPTVSAQDPSMQLKNLLRLPATTPSTTRDENDPAALRENKASAMLSLLRGAEPSRNVEPPPQTPYDQIISQPSRPPASPKHRIAQLERTPSYAEPPKFPFSPSQTSNGVYRQAGLFPHAISGSTPESNEKQYVSSSKPMQLWHQQHIPHRPDVKVQNWNGGETPQDTHIAGDRHNIGPPASKLPLPKLNAHSSALLSLFKGAPRKQQPESAAVLQLPAENLVDPPELSASRPTTVLQPQYAFHKPALSNVIGTTSALTSSLPSHPAKSTPRSTSQHQENLLSLFKAPKFSGKASPSLVPPPGPVELAANQYPPYEQDSPPENWAAIDNTTSATLTSSTVAIKRPKRSLDLSNPNLSATVTGPLNVPQFESIQKPSAKRVHGAPQAQAVPSSLKEIQQPVRILTRPGSSHKSASEEERGPRITEPRRAPHESFYQHRAKISSGESSKPFQPQILKRPPTSPSPVDRMANQPPQPQQQSQLQPQPQKILTRPSDPEPSPRVVQNTDQKAALLSLFGRSNTNLSSHGQSAGFPVSPLSEKPAMDSGIVSPTGVGRSRIGSLQSLDDETLPDSGRQTPQMIASPHDKQFLLGFLDGVAREGRR